MKDDIISRSALVAELECFKVACGDVVIRVIVDRIIGIVKDQPGVGADPFRNACSSCKHGDVDAEMEPCLSCIDQSCVFHPRWEAAPNEAV